MPRLTALALAALTTAHLGHPRPSVVILAGSYTPDAAWAIAHAALSPGLELLGVVAADPRGPAQLFARLPWMQRPPVVRGALTPLANGHTPQTSRGSDFLLTLSRDFSADHRLSVVAIGDGTDLASALIADPGLAGRITVAWAPSPAADPAARAVVLASHAPLALAAAHATRGALTLPVARARAIVGAHGRAGADLATSFGRWVAAHPERCLAASGSHGAWPMSGELALAHVLGLSRETSAGPARSTIDGVDAPRLWRDLDAVLDHAQAR